MKRTFLAVAALIALFMLVAHLEWRNTPTEENMRSAYLRPCDATITDGEHYKNMPDPRCYFFKDRR